MTMGRWDDRFPDEMDDGRHYTFYYQIERSLNYNRRRIEECMDEIESFSRIRFEPRRRQRCYLTITESLGCWMNGVGEEHRPRISFGMASTEFGTLLHELMYAVGFELEHNRPDRSDYIIINWRNIEYGNEDQFKKLRPSKYEWMDFDIDFESVMMYNNYEFSANDDMTIQRRDGEEIDTNDELSDMDIEKLRLL
ncbi:Zinc metalloproteinase nas-6 [Araneus ventricosus]|uniref:Metalloendopeptidase n=1 Tax=Araneus ventricosus TaxID=182803 RepID=A0A4Y2IJV2_ARAVE|nr:Zinc metalloproteinase nas-6 [Araneus ventricosus]